MEQQLLDDVRQVLHQWTVTIKELCDTLNGVTRAVNGDGNKLSVDYLSKTVCDIRTMVDRLQQAIAEQDKRLCELNDQVHAVNQRLNRAAECVKELQVRMNAESNN